MSILPPLLNAHTADNPITKSRKFVNDDVIALETQQKGLTQTEAALTDALSLT